MKILLFDNAGIVSTEGHYYCVEGTGRFASELVGLGAVVTMYGQKVESKSTVSVFDIEAHGIKVAGLNRMHNKLLNYIRLYCYAIKFLLESDFIYFFYPGSYRFLALICHLLKKKYGLYIRGEEQLEDNVSKLLYKKASVVLTVSQNFTNMVNTIAEKHVADTIKPMLTYNDSDIVHNRVYDKKDRMNILLLSRIQKEKGIIELLNAFSAMKEKGYDDIYLTIAGNGAFLEQAQIESERLQLNNSVHFLGGIYDDKEKAEVYKKADIYILPTYNEGFPRTLYEAMIFGTPIITSFVGGIPALMKDKENCLRIEPHSVDSIVKALEFAICNYSEMGRMARNATSLVSKIVDRERPSHACQLYQKIIEYVK